MYIKWLQSCLTLCNPMDCSPPGSSVHGILQARILEWVAMPSSRGSSQPRDQTCVSYVSCIGRQVLYPSCHLGHHVLCAVLSHSVMSDSLRSRGLQPARLLCPWGFSRQEYWRGHHALLQGDLPDPGIKPTSLMSPALADRFFITSTTWEA